MKKSITEKIEKLKNNLKNIKKFGGIKEIEKLKGYDKKGRKNGIKTKKKENKW